MKNLQPVKIIIQNLKAGVNFDELNLFFHPDLNQTLGFDRVYDIAKAATEYVSDQQEKVDWGDPVWVEKLKLASALNPRNNPIFDEFCKSMNINFSELDSRTAKLLSSGVRRTLGKWATAHLRANGGRLSRDDRKSYFSRSKQEKLVSKTEWVRKHPDGMKLAEEADKLDKLLIDALGLAQDLKEHLDNYTEEANLGFGVPSKKTISNKLNSTVNKLVEICWTFDSSDYYKAFGDEKGFEMNGGDPRISNS